MTIEIFPSAANVIVLRIQGKVEHAEVMRMIDLMEESINSHDKTHVFAEVIDFSGLEAAQLGEYLRRAGPFLKNLKRFGRIAVVSDQTWMRAVAKVESALLPNISYETFTLSQRDEALAWVEGRRARPHGTGLRIVETSRPEMLAFELDGKITEDELELIADRFTEKRERRPTRVIGKIVRLGGAEIKGLVDDDFVKMKIAAFSSVERYALVGGPAWLARYVSLINTFTKADLRHFPLEDEAAAWKWVEAELQ